MFQGSSEDECQSMEASHNSVVVNATSASWPSNPADANPSTAAPSQASAVATTAVTVLEEELSPTLGRSHVLDGSRGQFSREQCGGEPAEKQQGESYVQVE